MQQPVNTMKWLCYQLHRESPFCTREPDNSFKMSNTRNSSLKCSCIRQNECLETIGTTLTTFKFCLSMGPTREKQRNLSLTFNSHPWVWGNASGHAFGELKNDVFICDIIKCYLWADNIAYSNYSDVIAWRRRHDNYCFFPYSPFRNNPSASIVYCKSSITRSCTLLTPVCSSEGVNPSSLAAVELLMSKQWRLIYFPCLHWYQEQIKLSRQELHEYNHEFLMIFDYIED